ncbi:MAG TPA: metallophosphoesterase family protein [Armatimonadota bacterium]|nr:metallophosphoesterase family protein [Armatimonadota bacterium]HOS43413.1 metallophosphoesterase family protein [Armatimonadota bacterium]
MRIGVIADTHGRVPAGVGDAFAGVVMILHAGDIGGEGVIAELATLARVVAVRGNTDVGFGPPLYPDTRRLTLAGVEIFLCHEPSRADALTPPPDVVIHGHTHKARNERINGVLWFNPGTAGKPQFDARTLSVGVLTVEDGQVTGDIIPVG